MTAVEYLYKNLLDNPMSNEDVIYNINVFDKAKKMENKEKLINQLFIGKVSDEIGLNKTIELLKESRNAFLK